MAAWTQVAFEAVRDKTLHRELVDDSVKSVMRERRDQLDAALVPARREAVAALLATLAGMARSQRLDADTSRAIVLQEVDDLSDVSQWALAAAVRAYRVGDVGDGQWRPTAGQLRLAAKKHELTFRVELNMLATALDSALFLRPPPEKPVSRERWESLVASLRAGIQGVQTDGDPAPVVSPELGAA